MSDLQPAIAAFATSLLSALALYAGSAHCRWPALQRLARHRVGWAGAGRPFTWLWVLALGGGAGLCVMLGTWMLAMMAVSLSWQW